MYQSIKLFQNSRHCLGSPLKAARDSCESWTLKWLVCFVTGVVDNCELCVHWSNVLSILFLYASIVIKATLRSLIRFNKPLLLLAVVAYFLFPSHIVVWYSWYNPIIPFLRLRLCRCGVENIEVWCRYLLGFCCIVAEVLLWSNGVGFMFPTFSSRVSKVKNQLIKVWIF